MDSKKIQSLKTKMGSQDTCKFPASLKKSKLLTRCKGQSQCSSQSMTTLIEVIDGCKHQGKHILLLLSTPTEENSQAGEIVVLIAFSDIMACDVEKL